MSKTTTITQRIVLLKPETPLDEDQIRKGIQRIGGPGSLSYKALEIVLDGMIMEKVGDVSDLSLAEDREHNAGALDALLDLKGRLENWRQPKTPPKSLQIAPT